MKLNEVLGFVDDPETGMPSYDDMIRDPNYFARAKQRKHGIVMMSPDEYIDKATKAFQRMEPSSGYSRDIVMKTRDPELVAKYAEQMKGGEKFPTLVLDYSRGFEQEGLHRAIAAKKLGVEEIPVMVVSTTRNKERRGRRPQY